MVRREDVLRAYKIILGREPENHTVIARHMEVGSLPDLVHTMVNSEEFARMSYNQKAHGFEGAAKLIDGKSRWRLI
jgi:hypothetical protein